MPIFKRNEYLDRNSVVMREAEGRDLDAILVLDFSHLHWLTGLDGDTAYLTQAVLVRPGIDEPQLWVRAQDWNGARHCVFMADSNIHAYPETYVGGSRHALDYIGAALVDQGLGAARIGIEMGDRHYSVSAAARLKAAMPNATFVDIGDTITLLRAPKSLAEITYMRQAAILADVAMRAAIDRIEDGAREADVAATIAATRIAGVPEYAGGWAGPFSYMPTGRCTNTPHMPWGDGRLAAGMGVNLEVGAARHRYVAAVSRTIHVGPPPPELRQLHDATLEGLEDILGLIAPGVLCKDVEERFRRTTARHGVVKNSRIGYGIGIDWTESAISLQPEHRVILKPNMTLHLMLGMWRDRDGYTLSETVRVTDAGCETLSTLPRYLFIK